jgi:sporulation protein YlmC with PRC-barrel domain
MKCSHNLLAAGTLIGDKVINNHNEYIGKIVELMISIHDGRVCYAVMSFDGVFGFGSKFFALPWSVLDVDQGKKCFVLDVDKERLINAPGFDKDHWPDMSDSKWTTEIHSYYKYTFEK